MNDGWYVTGAQIYADIVTGRGIPNILGGRSWKADEYCKNTANIAKTQPILQKHSQYCKNTVNTGNINIVTNRGILNIHGGKPEISKDDEYCNNTASVNWES